MLHTALTSAMLQHSPLPCIADTELCEGGEYAFPVMADGTLGTEDELWAGLFRGVQMIGSRERLPPPLDSTWSSGGHLMKPILSTAIVHTPAGCP